MRVILVIAVISMTSGEQLSQKDRVKRTDVYFYSPHRKTELSVDKMISDSKSRQLFNLDLPLKVLIHGWQGDRNHITIEPVKNAYLTKGNCNLFIVDWSSGAGQNYKESRELVPHVAKRAAKILNQFLESFNIPLESVHILGHSLGAHIAGNVGKYFNGLIGRITALDPAGPLFFKASSDACSPSDAKFVDVIHTDGGVLGEMTPRGHVDFYPNRGLPPQPGCQMLDLFTASSCSHYRAPLLYAESILIRDNFIGTGCSTDELLHSVVQCLANNGHMRSTAVMGEYVNSSSASGIYFMKTNNSPPYGRGALLI